MRQDDRDQAIAVAQACILTAKVGEPKLLYAHHLSGNEPMSDFQERMLRETRAPDAVVEKMNEIWSKRRVQPRWEVSFLLLDPRYVSGVTVAFVTIDDTTDKAEFEVYQPGGGTVP